MKSKSELMNMAAQLSEDVTVVTVNFGSSPVKRDISEKSYNYFCSKKIADELKEGDQVLVGGPDVIQVGIIKSIGEDFTYGDDRNHNSDIGYSQLHWVFQKVRINDYKALVNWQTVTAKALDKKQKDQLREAITGSDFQVKALPDIE